MQRAKLLRVITLAILLFTFVSCGTQRYAAVHKINSSKTLLATTDKGWVKYRIYQLPTDNTAVKKAKHKQSLVFSIMIINAQGGASPLRKISNNLEQYNVLYEYLLNQTKNDLALVNGTNVLYPSYCSFENNYNAFPFETLNVGFSAEALSRYKIRKSRPVKLLYADKIFSHDTLTCDITKVM